MGRRVADVGFNLAIVSLTLAFLMIGWVLRELIMPDRPDGNGHYRGDSFLVGLVTISLSLILADVIVGTVFHAMGWTERRRSVLRHRPAGRAA
ncbi:MAG: hypothetical protein ACYC61_01055 [Isosphaeraceae bacterium]